MKKTMRFLLVAVLVVVFVLPIQLAYAEVNSVKIFDEQLMEDIETSAGPFSIYVSLNDKMLGVGSLSVGAPNLLIERKKIEQMWNFDGTVLEWWEKYETVAREVVRESLRPFFDDCDIDVDSVELDPYYNKIYLTADQIKAISQKNYDEMIIKYAAVYPEQSYEIRTVFPDYSADDALVYLQKVVGIIEKNVVGTFNFKDYNKDGDKNSADALFILQCSVGKRNGGAYPSGPVVD